MNQPFTHASLFSGIGGFDLAAQWMNWENIFSCEINPFCNTILKHYWPQAEHFLDITKTDFTPYANRIDILTGGFPCQPYSLAGKRKGTEDERHLWPQMLRAVREIKPRWIVGENVFGIVNWSAGMVFNEVQANLEAEGYEVFAYVLPACGINAPHKRERTWFVAYSMRERYNEPTTGENTSEKWKDDKKEQNHRHRIRPEVSGYSGPTTNCNNQRCKQQSRNKITNTQGQLSRVYEDMWYNNFPTQPPVCGRNDGLPTKLDGITFPKWRRESIKGYGNAIVPQLALQIFKTIELYEQQI